MTQEQYDELRRDLVTLKVDMGVVKTKLEHIEELADTTQLHRRFWISTSISVAAVLVAAGSVWVV